MSTFTCFAASVEFNETSSLAAVNMSRQRSNSIDQTRILPESKRFKYEEGMTSGAHTNYLQYLQTQPKTQVSGVESNFQVTPVTLNSAAALDSISKTHLTRPNNSRASTVPISKLYAQPTAPNAAQFGSVNEIRADSVQTGESSSVGAPLHRAATEPSINSICSDSAQKDFIASGLVGASVLAIESIWGKQIATEFPAAGQNSSVLPLHWFVKEVLRRSRTSCSTLQLALYYLHKSRKIIRENVFIAEQTRKDFQVLDSKLRAQQQKLSELGNSYPSPPASPQDESQYFNLQPSNQQERWENLSFAHSSPILCGRRMFLASLISASKFLQDRNYSNRAWAKLSGLNVQEINLNERAFLGLIKFDLFLPAQDFAKWTERLSALTLQGIALETAAVSVRVLSSAVPTSPRISSKFGAQTATPEDSDASLSACSSEDDTMTSSSVRTTSRHGARKVRALPSRHRVMPIAAKRN